MIQRLSIRFALCLALAIALAGPSPVSAQEDQAGASFITPFPEGDIYKLQVVGDSLAEGALAGLVEAFGADSRLQINRRHRQVSGMLRGDAEEDFKGLEEAMTREPSHITVVMLGREDRWSMRAAGNRRLEPGRNDWREEYGRRVDKMMKVLKRRGGAVYWIGLPGVQRRDWNDIVQVINDTVRDRAYLNGIRFIDAYAGFADENGSFVAMGPDAAGLVRRLRESDGISFTSAGNRKLAHFVEREIRRDLAQAKAERAIPLAGSEVEQRKISPPKPAATAATAPVASQPSPKAGETRAPWSATTAVVPPAAASAGGGALEQKADNSRIALRAVNQAGREETTTLDILRPAIPASVIQLIARNASPDRATQVGDTLQDNLPGGLLALSSVSPASDGQGGGRRSKLAPTQTPYFRVMVKGERLPPKPGRADDFRWPRPDQMVEAPVVQPAAAPTPATAATRPAPATRQPGAEPRAAPRRP